MNSKNKDTYNAEKEMMIPMLWLSFLFSLAALFSLFWQTAICAGILIGLGATWFTQIVLFIVSEKKIIKGIRLYSWLRWTFRLLVGGGMFAIILAVINPLFNNNSVVELIHEPISGLSYLFAYTIPVYSVFLLPLKDKLGGVN